MLPQYGSIRLTLHWQQNTVDAWHLLVCSLDQLHSSLNCTFVASIHEQQGALERTALIRIRLLFYSTLSRRCTQELGEHKQLLLQLCSSRGHALHSQLVFDLLELLLMLRCEIIFLLL